MGCQLSAEQQCPDNNQDPQNKGQVQARAVQSCQCPVGVVKSTCNKFIQGFISSKICLLSTGELTGICTIYEARCKDNICSEQTGSEAEP